jgi:transposase
VYAKPFCPAGCPCDVVRLLHGRHRVGARLVMILLSCQHWPPAAIAELLGCDPSTVRRWVHRYNTHGTAGLCDRPRPGRPRLGSRRLGARIRRLLAQPLAWTIPRLWQRLGRPAISRRTLHRRVREVAAWRRPRLVAKGDPSRDQVLADLQQQLRNLPEGAVVLAEDETHINLLPWIRATWIANGCRQRVMTPGTNRRRTIFGAVELATGRFCYQISRKAVSASFTAFLAQLLAAYQPRRWWRWSATTSSSTAPSSSKRGWHPTHASGCCTGRATAPTTTPSNASGRRSRRGWPTHRR